MSHGQFRAPWHERSLPFATQVAVASPPPSFSRLSAATGPRGSPRANVYRGKPLAKRAYVNPLARAEDDLAAADLRAGRLAGVALRLAARPLVIHLPRRAADAALAGRLEGAAVELVAAAV